MKLNSASDERAASRTSDERRIEQGHQSLERIGQAARAKLPHGRGLHAGVRIVECGENQRVGLRVVRTGEGLATRAAAFGQSATQHKRRATRTRVAADIARRGQIDRDGLCPAVELQQHLAVRFQPRDAAHPLHVVQHAERHGMLQLVQQDIEELAGRRAGRSPPMPRRAPRYRGAGRRAAP